MTRNCMECLLPRCVCYGVRVSVHTKLSRKVTQKCVQVRRATMYIAQHLTFFPSHNLPLSFPFFLCVIVCVCVFVCVCVCVCDSTCAWSSLTMVFFTPATLPFLFACEGYNLLYTYLYSSVWPTSIDSSYDIRLHVFIGKKLHASFH